MAAETFDLVFRSRKQPDKLYRAEDVDTFFITDPENTYNCEKTENGLECFRESEN
jgi:hypothetical protein